MQNYNDIIKITVRGLADENGAKWYNSKLYVTTIHTLNKYSATWFLIY